MSISFYDSYDEIPGGTITFLLDDDSAPYFLKEIVPILQMSSEPFAIYGSGAVFEHIRNMMTMHLK